MADSVEFVDRLRHGDTAAIDAMVKAELPRIYNLCLRLSRNPSDAEDLVQQTFVNAVRGLVSFKGESQVSTWLYRIAVNTWKNRVRYERRRQQSKHVSLSGARNAEGEDEPMDIAGLDRPPEEWVALHSDHQILLQAIAILDNEDRGVIVLRDMEGRSYEDIADILNMNLGTLKSRISRAREKLRVVFRRLGGRPS